MLCVLQLSTNTKLLAVCATRVSYRPDTCLHNAIAVQVRAQLVHMVSVCVTHAGVTRCHVNLQLNILLLCENTRAFVCSGTAHAVTASAYCTSSLAVVTQAPKYKQALERLPFQ